MGSNAPPPQQPNSQPWAAGTPDWQKQPAGNWWAKLTGIQDPALAAQQQADASKQVIDAQTQANRPNINGPVGSQQWTQDANGRWTLNSGFSPEFQGVAGALGGQAAANMSTPFDLSQFGPLDNGSAARDQAISGTYNQAASRLNPQWAQRDEQLKSQLANQGLDPNSQAARAANLQEGQQRNDAYSSAMNDAVKNGTLAQAQTYSQNLQTRQQAIMEALQQRGLPLQELQQLQAMSGAPNFSQAGASQPPNLLGAQQLGQQQAASTMQGIGQGAGGLAALLSALAMAG